MSSKKLISSAIVAAAVTAGGLAGAVIGAPVISGAQDAGTPTTTAPAAPGTAAPDGHGTGAPGDRTQGGHVGENGTKEELLTGDTAEKVKAAALAANPGATVDRVETDAEGSPYEAHITKADGTHATVKVDANFVVTATEDDKGGHGGGGGRHGGGKGGAGAPNVVTGADAEKATAAVVAANPGATVERVQKNEDGTYHAHITKADGTKARVELDANFAVTATNADTKPAR